MFIKIITAITTLLILLSSMGCDGRMRVERSTIQQETLFDAHAPDWVKGYIPDSENRIFFVGRSENPFLLGTRVNRNRAQYNTNYYYDAWTSERDAVSSARDDVYDQIRQRLAPRNVGNASNLVVGNIESGTCTNCGTIIPIYRTGITVCNETCSHSGDNCNSTNISSTRKNTFFCQDCHSPVASCSGCASIVHAVTQLNRTPDQLNSADFALNRDINMININVDSLMPSLAAYMTEDELYFEKRNNWYGFKCWMLCSIPVDEFYEIAEDFRNKYEDQYELAQLRAEEDRNRRITAENEARIITLERQTEERAWNREDELVTRAHTIELDKDRHVIPGRRFTLETE